MISTKSTDTAALADFKNFRNFHLCCGYELERGSEYDVTAKLVIRNKRELSATLTKQQNDILEKSKTIKLHNQRAKMNWQTRKVISKRFSDSV